MNDVRAIAVCGWLEFRRLAALCRGCQERHGMVGIHELTVEEVLWLTRMSRGRLLKDPIELGMPDNVRATLIAKSLAMAQGGLLEITPEGLAETTRRAGVPPTQDVIADRAPVFMVISPLADDGMANRHGEGFERQKKLSANLLRIAVEAAIIDQAAAKLNEPPAAASSATALADAEQPGRRVDSDSA